MLPITKQLLSSTPYDYFTDTEVAVILGKGASEAKRYGLVKRAIAKGEILRLKRGVYIFAEEYRRKKLNLFEIADLLYHPSYVSLESALSYYGAIPEAVYAVTCISTNRKKSIQTAVSRFDYFSLPPRCFYSGVSRISTDAKGGFLMASLEKAILDYLRVYKKSWASVKDLVEDLRFDEKLLEKLDLNNLILLKDLYKNRRINRFVEVIIKEFAK